jgi:beta-mannosidase
MLHTLDLTAQPWQLSGWLPWSWELNLSMELGIAMQCEVGPLPMRLPASIQQTLLDARLIPDWRYGLDARGGEWVENRHWVIETQLPAEWCDRAGSKRVVLDGIDGLGQILLDRTPVLTVANTFLPHSVDLTAALAAKPGARLLRLVFTDQPRALGQVCRSSRISDWKSRYTYQWDWSPRVMQLAVWQGVRLEVRDGAAFESARLRSTWDHAAGRGTVQVVAPASNVAPADRLVATIYDGERVLGSASAPAAAGQVAIDGIAARPWMPNGHGERAIYRVRVALVSGGADVDARELTTGFREVAWKPCAGAPAGARDWLCCINGRSIFLQGANWVPLRTCFADVTEAEYRARLTTYRDLGFNLLRVWGGAPLEREVFYRICDELGILIWQEFPLSSSGIDNHPPSDPRLCLDMMQIVRHYAASRQHHPALLMWCGGNELQRALDGGPGIGMPCDEREPMLAVQAATINEMDPGRRYVPASSSGPRFVADAKDYGKGIHHDVHGPWNMPGDLTAWKGYWDRDDALFRSETGFPAAQDAALTRRYGRELAWPANRQNPYWSTVTSWWIQWDDWLRENGGAAGDLDGFVAWSQRRQAEALAHAVDTCHRRFPAIGGIILWMGHDCWPCPANTAVIDVEGRPKPAALAVAERFRRHPHR